MIRRARDDAGFTMVELMITMLISTIAMGAIVGMLEGQMKVERRVDAFANNQEEIRDALVALQRDIRSSAPPVALATVEEYKRTLRLDLYTDLTSAAVPIQWRATSDGVLLREDLSTTPATVTHQLRGLDPALDQLFFYEMTNGQLNLAPPAPAVPPLPTDVARCVVRIRIVLRAAPYSGPQPAPLESEVQIRNRTTPPAGCPTTTESATP